MDVLRSESRREKRTKRIADKIRGKYSNGTVRGTWSSDESQVCTAAGDTQRTCHTPSSHICTDMSHSPTPHSAMWAKGGLHWTRDLVILMYLGSLVDTWFAPWKSNKPELRLGKKGGWVSETSSVVCWFLSLLVPISEVRSKIRSLQEWLIMILYCSGLHMYSFFFSTLSYLVPFVYRSRI